MKVWYRIVKWFMFRYHDRFFPELPRELWNVFRRVDMDIEHIRFQNKVLAVHQVDFVLDTVGLDIHLEPQEKMYYKNRLLELGLMVYGFTLGQDNEVTRVDRSLVHMFETQKRLWNKGRLPKLRDEIVVSKFDVEPLRPVGEPEPEEPRAKDEIIVNEVHGEHESELSTADLDMRDKHRHLEDRDE